MIAKSTVQQLMDVPFKTKLRAGRYYIPVTIEIEDGRMLFNFGYNQELIEEIKTSFEDRKYHGYIDGDGRKLWSAPITYRNLFQLEALQGKYGPNPYARWENLKDLTEQIKDYCANRHKPLEPFAHQYDMVSLMLQTHWFVNGGEMGTGKTLATIIAIEMCPYNEYGQILWGGVGSALSSAKLEFRKWDAKFMPMYYTYAGLRKLVEEWVPDTPAPRVLVLDESSRCGNPTAKQSVAAQYIADSMRAEWGDDCYIFELSGAPAAKHPGKWWKQAEIACPGFLREADIYKFRERIAIIEKRESTPGGGAYNHLKTWRDSEEKCHYCGETKDHANHKNDFLSKLVSPQGPTYEVHDFVPGINEVEKIFDRLHGLVGIWRKSECTDLPPKRYEEIVLEPSRETLNAASLIVQNTIRAADALIRLRTLSDGFLYSEIGTGEYKPCKGCKGTGKVFEYFEEDNPYDIILPEEVEGGFRYIWEECPPDEDPITFVPAIIGQREAIFKKREIDCFTCQGRGEIEVMTRKISEVPCPKVDLLKELLEQHEEVGRFNIYAGFEGSILRCVRTCLQAGWAVIRADGKAKTMQRPTGEVLDLSFEEMLYLFQEEYTEWPKISFVGQPGAAGLGLNLQASPTTFFYSNDFNADSRIQAEDRGHRFGMDKARGGRIIDCIHLPSDQKVIESLKKSKELQLMSMKCLQELYKDVES